MQIKQKNSYPNMISYVTLNYPSQLDFFLGHVKGKELCSMKQFGGIINAS